MLDIQTTIQGFGFNVRIDLILQNRWSTHKCPLTDTVEVVLSSRSNNVMTAINVFQQSKTLTTTNIKVFCNKINTLG
jgi:hypothetical protein